jgi:N-acetylneuraminic acid mutarotase
MRLFYIFFLFYNVAWGQKWIRLPDFPSLKRDDGVAVTVNDKAYFGTGLVEWDITADFYALDLSTYGWSAIPSMPGGAERQYACGFAGPDCFFVFGGDGIGGALNNMYKYNITTSTWASVASKPGNGLIAASSMNFGDKIIIVAGKYQSGQVSSEVWEYTISDNTWSQKNNFPFAGRWRASASVLNNSGYLLFGIDNAGVFRKELYKYIPAADQWTVISDFPLPKGRAYAAMQMANTQLFLFGGCDTLNTLYKDSWYFKETTGAWTQGPDLPSTGRKGGMSCAKGDFFFYSCGIGEGPTRLTETWMTDIPLGIKEISREESFSVYPNPTKGVILISSAKKNGETFAYSLNDIFGKELYFGKNKDASATVEIAGLAPGVYFLSLFFENDLMEVKRIIKE